MPEPPAPPPTASQAPARAPPAPPAASAAPPPAPPAATSGADPWAPLRALTPARIGLARSGAALATRPLLEFRLAHARARDAVHATLDAAALAAALATPDRPALLVHSRCPDRTTYLRRPDLGRDLDDAAAAVLQPHAAGWDLALVVVDGLSARAAAAAAPLLHRIAAALGDQGWRIAPPVVVRQGRVASGDKVAALLRAGAVAVLIGERPGLSVPESLGAYLTWAPGPATTDAARNCVSNIHAHGLDLDAAAHRIVHLLAAMRAGGRSGVSLKDLSGDQARPEALPLDSARASRPGPASEGAGRSTNPGSAPPTMR